MTDTAKVYLDQQRLVCEGAWNLANLTNLQRLAKTLQWPESATLKIDGSALNQIDSAGAWLLATLIQQIKTNKNQVQLDSFSEQATKLLSMVDDSGILTNKLPKVVWPTWLERVGLNTIGAFFDFSDYLAFIGKLTTEFLRLIKNPFQIRWNSFFSSIDTTGYQALPIIALLSFMVGLVLAYQMGVQLRNYGANIFVVDLLGLSVLREFGPLLTAIMVAGRTGSAFTAQLGIMKINQEIDALDTMGITSSELLLLPRIFALTLTLPLLTIWADIFGVMGGMVMANNMLDITWYDFLHRFEHSIPLRTLLIGLGKAPVFALIISSVGCFQGMNVNSNADSLGKNTTKSVVLAIFFIIVADALFSIILSRLRL